MYLRHIFFMFNPPIASVFITNVR